MRIPKERKQAILKKIMKPDHKPFAQIAREEGISLGTIYNWRNEARRKGLLLPKGDLGPSGWSSQDKFAAVLESAAMNEAELAEYCRKRALYPAQIKSWRLACEQANDWDSAVQKQLNETIKEEQRRSKALESQLKRKEKALAEAAALLVLSKKAQAIWGDDEDV